jgi:ketosteroid isomerase-like protein
MRKVNRIVFPCMVLLTTIVLKAPCQASPAPGMKAAGPEADIVAIAELWSRYADSVSNGNLEAWLTLWAPNARRMVPNQPILSGMAEFQPKTAAHFASSRQKMVIRIEETVVTGNTAYSRGSYDHWMQNKAGGTPMKWVGKYLDILERQSDGSWKIILDCFNYDAPPLREENFNW